MRAGAAILTIWLIIGAIAAAQRSYFAGPNVTCAGLGTIAITIVAGPLNYVGLNPKIECNLPQPSP
ncbi:MAG TPA: hypothetical protein VGI84_05430 [Pseudonocardiaceae bacterium]|jgi:hypothetical protein